MFKINKISTYSMKQVILVRNDLKLPRGKLSAQVAHASVEAVHRTPRLKLGKWKLQGSKKVVLKVKDLVELLNHEQKAKKAGLKTALITDAAKTFFTEPTKTCLAIGPDEEKKIDKITGKLKML